MEETIKKYYAHSKDGAPISQWQLLEDHLKNTAEKAAKFAESFSAGEWGRVSGLCHDLGKYSDDFQTMLLNSMIGKNSRHVDHSTSAAIHVEKQFNLGRILSYIIAGHHAGLPDWQSEFSGAAGLAYRLQQTELFNKLPLSLIPSEIAAPNIPASKPEPGLDPAFWIRMLFSCLVDADFLDTESFLQPDKYSSRSSYPYIIDLLPAFNKFIKEKIDASKKTTINALRKEILERCISFASNSPGFFSLTVPTGGGKTLSSMAFALCHAQKYKKQRVIYVIPYTSIIEQTADQFRQIFGEVVIEHHSNFDNINNNTDAFEKQLIACENWDAPIVITTSVQFFESLFSNRPSRCRKLHNIVNSVIILDEAQLLPPEFLNPILKVLRELQKYYGVTIVLSTATQPALRPRHSIDFTFEGVPGMIEIIENPRKLYESFKRVQVALPADLNRSISWEDLARELIRYPSVLCVVNRRDDARQLYRLMPEGTFHLSALMCGAHRSVTITRIKEQLKQGIPIRVISTQLVEAGVDLDFPVVYRALAGLDSIAQAAGRCNREGKLKCGEMIVFIPPSEIPPGHLRQAAGISRRLLENTTNPLTPEKFEQFFTELYWLKGEDLDSKRVISDLTPGGGLHINFRSAASKFRIIDDSLYASVLVRYGEGEKLVGLLEKIGPERWLMRKLQRYVVNIPKYIFSDLLSVGGIREIHPGIVIQESLSLYDPDLGFCPDRAPLYKPDDLII